MEYFLIYLLVMLDQFAKAVEVGFIISAVFIAVYWFVYAVNSVDNPLEVNPLTKYMMWPKRAFIFGCVCAVLVALLPSTQKAAIIIGGGMVVSAVTSEKGQQVAGRIGGALEEKLYEILKVKPQEVAKDEPN